MGRYGADSTFLRPFFTSRYWEPYGDAGAPIAGMPGWAWLNFTAYLITIAIQWYLVYVDVDF